MPSYDPLYYLQRMPHEGPQAALAAACKALGFQVGNQPDGCLVQHEGLIVATISGDRLVIDSAGIARLAGPLPALTVEQGKALNRALLSIEFENIALHEAGHAVYASRHGLDFCYVRIGEQSELHLCADSPHHDLDYSDDGLVEDFQEMWAAGAAAETIVVGGYRPYGPADDRVWVNVMEIMKIQQRTGTAPPHTIDVFDEFVRRAEQQLNRDDLVKVADALKQRRFLSYSEVESILESAPR